MADETTTEEQTEAPKEEKTVAQPAQTVDNGVVQQYQTLVSQKDDEIRKYKEQLSAFGEVTPEQIKELQEFKRKQAVSDAAGNPDQLNQLWEERVLELREKEFGPALQKERARAEQAEAKLKKVTVVNELLNNHMPGLRAEAREDAESRILKHAEMDDTGNFRFRDENGNILYSPADPSRPLNAAEFNGQLKVLKPHWYEPDGINKGSRQDGQTTAARQTGSNNKYEQMTREEWLASRHEVEDRTERVRIDQLQYARKN